MLARLKKAWGALLGTSFRNQLHAFLTTGLGRAISSTGWTSDRYEMLRHYNHWVYVAVRAIAETVAQQEIQLGYKIAGSKDPVPAPVDHPLYRLFRNPNSPDTAFDFWHELIVFLELTGNAYVWAVPNYFGVPCELWCIPSHWVWYRPRMSPTAEDYYEIRPTEGVGACVRVPVDEMIHFKHPSPLSKFDGWSPVGAISRWVDNAESIDKSRLASFSNGAWPGIAIELPEEAEFDISDEVQLKRLAAMFNERFRGVDNRDKLIIVGGGAKVTSLKGYAPNEMDFPAGGEQSRDTILAAFRVPKTVCGLIEAVNRASMETSFAQFCKFTINPKLVMIAQKLTEKLAPKFEPNLCAYWPDPTPLDTEFELKRQETLARNGALTVNEWRKSVNLPPFKHGGDDPFVPSGMTTIPWNTGHAEYSEIFAGIEEPTKQHTDEPNTDTRDTEATDTSSDATASTEMASSAMGNGKYKNHNGYTNRIWGAIQVE